MVNGPVYSVPDARGDVASAVYRMEVAPGATTMLISRPSTEGFLSKRMDILFFQMVGSPVGEPLVGSTARKARRNSRVLNRRSFSSSEASETTSPVAQ